jgi:hypothetical protein
MFAAAGEPLGCACGRLAGRAVTLAQAARVAAAARTRPALTGTRMTCSLVGWQVRRRAKPRGSRLITGQPGVDLGA